MKLAPALLLLVAACTAVPPRLDPGTMPAVPPEQRFILGVGDSAVEVDHLRIEADSVRGRTVSSKAATAGPEVAMARDTSLVLRRAYHGSPGIEFVFLPPVLLLGFIIVFRSMFGND